MRIRYLTFVVGAVLIVWLIATPRLFRTIFRLPDPLTLLALEYGWKSHSQSFLLFDNKSIEKSRSPTDFCVGSMESDYGLVWKGKVSSLKDFLVDTETRAFLIVKSGCIVHESYSAGYDRMSKFSSYSIAKSFVATLIGAALEEGKIGSLDDPIGSYLAPGDLSDQYWAVTIRQLLSMQSGIDLEERYDSIWAPVVRMYLTTDLDRFLAGLSGFQNPPGAAFGYRSVDTLVLAKVLMRATGVPLAKYLHDRIWDPLGAADTASWSVDSAERNVEKAFCCLNATARDFARLGTLYISQGAVGDTRVVSASWALAPTVKPNRSSVMMYIDGWWVPPGNARDGDFAAIGIYGQYLYVNPLAQTVIVKLSEYGIEDDEVATLASLRQIAHSVSETP